MSTGKKTRQPGTRTSGRRTGRGRWTLRGKRPRRRRGYRCDAERLESRLLLSATLATELVEFKAGEASPAVVGEPATQETASPRQTVSARSRARQWQAPSQDLSKVGATFGARGPAGRGDRAGTAVATAAEQAQVGNNDRAGQHRYYVEVLVFINSGFFNIGHADIAVTGGGRTTVYGQHNSGDGNGGFKDSSWQRRDLGTYLREEASGGYKVFVSQIPITAQQHREITEYLDHQWSNDDSYNAFDDNCAQNVGFVLKKWELLSDWKGPRNEINDDDFKFAEGDLHKDWISKDADWTNRQPGYLSLTPGGPSLYDSVQDARPAGIGSGSNSGSSSSGSSDKSSGSSSIHSSDKSSGSSSIHSSSDLWDSLMEEFV